MTRSHQTSLARRIRLSAAAVMVWMLAVPSCANEDAGERPDDRSASKPALGAGVQASPGVESGDVAGEFFGLPVSLDNYYFAKRVAYVFTRPWGAADLPQEKREDVVWESLILNYEAFQRGIVATEEAMDTRIDEMLREHTQSFTRRGDPDAYGQWVSETLGEDVELFENQIRYLIQIRKLREQVLEEQEVVVTEEEMRQEFLNEQHHVGGEMVTFTTKGEAEAFYERVKEPSHWGEMKAGGEHNVRPVSLMTLEAYIDLWSIPKDQMYAFHALEIGSVGPPMPFGREWSVYHLLEKRTGDLEEFPAKRESYHKQLESRKKYEALKQWIEDLKVSANRTTFVDASSRP